jgi:hypothetical protein
LKKLLGSQECRDRIDVNLTFSKWKLFDKEMISKKQEFDGKWSA